MTISRRPRSARRAPLLVVSAWPPELDRLRRQLPIRPRGLALATVGVGLVEAAHGTARLIAEARPAAILLVGTAGVYPGHQEAFPVGTAAVVGDLALLPQVLPGRHTYLPEILPRRAAASPALGRKIRAASGLPVASVACPLAITASARAAAFAARSGCVLENLEAFAVARAAAAARIPFAAVLGIANRVGPRGHREWQQHCREAAAVACDAVLALLRA
jgi:nucleoside phosphorylase